MTRPTRTRLTRVAAASTLTAGLALGALAVGGAASAAPTDRATVPDARTVTAAAQVDDARLAQVVARSVDSDAGSYLDRSGDLVVNVTDRADAAAVRAAGATPDVVRFSDAQLDRAEGVLADRASITGTSWAVDPRTNTVSVTADRSVTAAQMQRLRRVAASIGDRVEVERTAGRLSTYAYGGEAIYAGGGRCSLGFNVSTASGPAFLTAGHCTAIGSTWYSDAAQSRVLGTGGTGSFPGNDYGIVRTSTAGPSAVNLYDGTAATITGAGTPTVGQTVLRSGSTTGVFSGQVTGLNTTVNYAEGSVSGLIRTTVCAEGGDSGGSMFAGTTAYGLTSGGSGNCSAGGTTYFQPVTEALGVYGASIG